MHRLRTDILGSHTDRMQLIHKKPEPDRLVLDPRALALEDRWLALHLPAYRRLISRLGGRITGRILVLPCGRGAEMRLLADMEKEPIGGEKSDKLVWLAHRAVPEKEVWHISDPKSLPFQDMEFHTALCMNGLARLGENQKEQRKALAEMARVTRLGISITIELDHDKALQNILKEEEIISEMERRGWVLTETMRAGIKDGTSLHSLFFNRSAAMADDTGTYPWPKR